ncbi:bifunctional diaminohydroxyphosphoribosylaminopyrimidine deaminase/5-amino-6-(5-phosphoribosylamino)uracil reductase RibD [Malonomonas rubra]|uniref:bifunctional diaminohydroxyphosphoribosylaminopyrimidine deaminase/5-amino-6-(5-phosphoribosylamino)uracil reductase RibD n=1 Tax=Malonomonas rubra TaxID=57040 RepID=UPI0026ED2442|nr:bifunctional diaminohydroxyphosphoribosylaminopyrimidine deaminase/5-amino-6-(5-phosphoribosylamino)uracil reductase RibD [Malonomonas rubra]
MDLDIHRQYMQQAIGLARRGEGRTSPNPPVGALIVRSGKVVGQGFHPKAGEPHAEIFALRQAGGLARGADVYVTLEPCSHHGRTGPCANALVKAGVGRVFVGVQDPNPCVCGRGIEKLRQAGIEVTIGIEEQECRRLVMPFARLLSSGMPYTIYKAAMTLDGKTATASGDSKWITGEQSRLRGHLLRNRVEAIMVGVETVLADDPLLNTRLPDGGGRDPLRVVVDSHLRMPADAAMLQQHSTSWTLIATISDDEEKILRLQHAGAEVVKFPADEGKVSLPHLWHELGKRDVQRLLLEGGSTLAGAALTAGLIDQLQVFVAPKLIGGAVTYGIFSGSGCTVLAEAIPLGDLRYEQVDKDLLIVGEVERCLRG